MNHLSVDQRRRILVCWVRYTCALIVPASVFARFVWLYLFDGAPALKGAGSVVPWLASVVLTAWCVVQDSALAGEDAEFPDPRSSIDEPEPLAGVP